MADLRVVAASTAAVVSLAADRIFLQGTGRFGAPFLLLLFLSSAEKAWCFCGV